MAQEKTTKIHALSHDGRGIATIGEKTTFVEGALPNETIAYQITQKHRRFDEAETLSLLETSPDRTIPPCEHFGLCGGCNLQHMNTEKQISLKLETLLNQLHHFGQVAPAEILPVLNAQTLGYRRKARLGVKFVFKKDKLLVGFREKSSNYLADLHKCVVLHPQVGERFAELSTLIRSLDAYQKIPQIEIAIGDEQVALVFRHLVPLSDHDQHALIEFGKNFGFHIYLQPNPPALVSKIWPQNSPDRLQYSLPEEGLTYSFHPLDFTQVNLEINRSMIRQALALLEIQPSDHVLDLFCGIGNFSLAMAKRAHHVTGIEGSLEMVERAEENAQLNGIQNVSFFAANLTAPQNTTWIKPYDIVLLDPPRVGAKEILPYFETFQPRKIAYISCNPATLSRDAGSLVHQYGYRLKQVGMMNMFPHTAHIEAMAIFEKP